MIAQIINNNTIKVYDMSQFDIAAIMHSGQVFRYFESDAGYSLVVGGNYANIEQCGDKILIDCSSAEYFWDYFDLDTDYNQIKVKLSQKHKAIIPAINAGGGIRILRSGFIETIISFIISANNNIKRFTKTLNTLAQQFGDRLPNGLYSFPKLDQLAKISEDEYKNLGCGYRAPYLVKAVSQLKSIDIDILAKLSSSDLQKELQKISGVGPKVAACIMLFCGKFHRLETCPIDTWIHKALQTLDQNQKSALLADEFAGVAQQYIFYYLQHLRKDIL